MFGFLLILMLTACHRDWPMRPAFRGVELKPPLIKQPFTLQSTAGEPFPFHERTRGRVALLFFGYTHCPDICPVHMANIAAALEKLSHDERSRIDVVFVTTDPERDTPTQLRRWLDNFDRSFIGLRGDPLEINRIETSMQSANSVRTRAVSGDSTNYGVMHAAQVMAFTADDSMRVVYPFGTRQEDWAADLPRLLRYKGVDR